MEVRAAALVSDRQPQPVHGEACQGRVRAQRFFTGCRAIALSCGSSASSVRLTSPPFQARYKALLGRHDDCRPALTATKPGQMEGRQRVVRIVFEETLKGVFDVWVI